MHFHYSWLSTSGQLQDLDHCVVGEIVTYPLDGTIGNEFFYPSPPYAVTPVSDNPTILSVAATAGQADDIHPHNSFVTPYRSVVVDAAQTYRFNCSNYLNGEWVDFTNFTIERTVDKHSFNSSFFYTIVKAGSSAQVDPLP